MKWELGKMYTLDGDENKAEFTKSELSINRQVAAFLDGRPFTVEAMSNEGHVLEISLSDGKCISVRDTPIGAHGAWFWAGERRFFKEVKAPDLTLERLGLLMEAYDIQLIDKMGLHNSIAKITTLEGIKSVLDGMPSRIGNIREYKQTRDRMIQLESRIKNER